MPQRLVLRLQSDASGSARWVALDASGRPEGAVDGGPLAAAAEAATGRHVVALAPTAEVLLLSARVPPMTRQRAARAVPFALEDQVADDVETLHFCLGQRDGQGDLAVAVVAHGQMQAWLDAFTAAGLDVEQIYPELFGLPYEDGAWTLLVEDGGFLLRTGPQSGFAGEVDNLPVLLQVALDDAGDRQPLKLIVYSARPLPDLGAPNLPLEQRELDDPTTLLAQNLREREAIGLRTGPYGRRRGWSVQWQRWRVAAVLLAAWVVADTGSALIKQWQLQKELTSLNAAMAATYRKAFPEGGQLNLYSPRQQMESRLAALRRSAGGDSGFLSLLQTAGPLLTADPNLQIVSLAYRNNGLDLEVSASSLQGIDQLKQRLTAAQGIGVEVVSARTEGNRAQGKLRIEAPT
jgi:general secretion pathway protein L